MATDEERARLESWERYSVLVSRGSCKSWNGTGNAAISCMSFSVGLHIYGTE